MLGSHLAIQYLAEAQIESRHRRQRVYRQLPGFIEHASHLVLGMFS